MSVVLDIVDSSDIEDVEDDCILESVTYVNQKEMDKNNFDYIYKEKPLLAKFIEKCYDIENSKGMSSVINKTLIKYYNETNKTFKLSSDFEKVLKRSIAMLETDPKKIYTHIRHLCDILISSSVTRRIKPTTLSTNIEATEEWNRPGTSCQRSLFPEDSREPEANIRYPIAPELGKRLNNVGNGILKRRNSSENLCKISKVYITEANKVEDLTDENQSINNNIEKRNTINDNEKENKSTNDFSSEDDNKLLVPQKVVEVNDIRDPLDVEKIKKIEKEIARCKTIISKLDEQEVDDDSVNSPYIKSEKLKAKIVLLYDQMCNLTGNEPVKKRKIYLRVIEGHSESPVRRLETFLNNNIGPDGDPPFPDFSDVVECVGEANSEDNLGWTKHQILQEARALFIQCGRALQRRRQNREWQDLLHKVKLQRCDEDPADSDPALLKRLEENKRAAVKKESEILERYSMMQPVPQAQVTESRPSEISDKTEDRGVDGIMSCGEIVTPIDRSHCLCPEHELQTEDSAPDEDTLSAVSNEINDVSIKMEPEDEIEKQLEELGDDYTLTVVELNEDPFLIIEISDSSEEEQS